MIWNQRLGRGRPLASNREFTRLWSAEARRAKSQPWPNDSRPEKKKRTQLPSGSPEGDMAVSCALEGPDMGLAAPHCHPAPPGAQGNSWGCWGPAVAMLVAIQRPKRAKSVPRQKGPKPCKSTLGGSRGMKPPQPMAQITQRGPWGVCELHRTTRGASDKPSALLSYCSRANHQAAHM